MPAKSRPCQRCQELIPAERLEALPETRLCVKCSQEVGGEFDVTVVSENLAKNCQRAPQNQPPWGASKPASVSLRLSHV